MIERYLEVQVAVVGALLSKDVKNKDKDLKFLQDDDRRGFREMYETFEVNNHNSLYREKCNYIYYSSSSQRIV